MIKLLDISFHMQPDIRLPEIAIEAYKEGYGYANFFQKKANVVIVEHINYEGFEVRNNVSYRFFKSWNKFWFVPLKTLWNVRKENPDIALVQGNIFPLQVIALKLFLGQKVKIIVQHHGNIPFAGLKKVVQQAADKYTTAYLFTALGNAQIWLDNGIIKKGKPCFEVLEGSTNMKRQDKRESRDKLNIFEGTVFLWVGRLDVGKDPVTVLKGFEKYLHTNSGAKLYMIYQAETLLPEVDKIIKHNPHLMNSVKLVGKVDHELLSFWFSAADYYISGSHREGSGYALIEAMACGCIPIVTDIPPFRKITDKYGFLFEPGNPDSLCDALIRSSSISKNEFSDQIAKHFESELSFGKIADDIYQICRALTSK